MLSKFSNCLKEIKKLASQLNREVKLMELCGTHSQTVAQFGLKNILPENIKLISGPGCPVCVTANEDVDALVNLVLAGLPVATYGDALNLPGTYLSLGQAKAKGAEVVVVYSIEEALRLSQQKKDLVFFGIGFETTAPMSAWAIKEGLTIYSAHKLFPPAMEALLNLGEVRIDGFINPGHVSTIIGLAPYQKFPVPQVIAGFEAEDVLMAIYMLLKQIIEGRAELENEYTRSVRSKGNPQALKLMEEVFEVGPSHWRGLGIIPHSGLEIREKFKQGNAKIKYKKILQQNKLTTISCHGNKWYYNFKTGKKSLCQCGAILRGLKEPQDCPLFKKICTPENPQGACMVSVEGACQIEYNY